MDNDQNIDIPDPNDFSDPSPYPAKDADLASLCDILKGLGTQRVGCSVPWIDAK